MAFNETPRKPKGKAKYQLPTRASAGSRWDEYYMTEELEAKFRKLYPIHSNLRIMTWFGISHTTLQRFKKELGLTKNMKAIWKEQARDRKKICEENGYYDSIRGKRPSDATIEGIKRKYAEGFNPMLVFKEKHPRKYRKMQKEKGEKRKELFRKERLRVKYGMEPKTKLKVPLQKMSIAARAQKHRMIKCNNYFADEAHPWWVCYDSETKRSERREATAMKHGLKIVEGKDTITT